MANNKVQLADGTVLMDVTGVTVTPQTLRSGRTALAASGETITGTLEPAVPVTLSLAPTAFSAGQPWVLGAETMAKYGETASTCYKALMSHSSVTRDASFVPLAHNRQVCPAPVYVTCVSGMLYIESAKCPTGTLNIAGVIIQ